MNEKSPITKDKYHKFLIKKILCRTTAVQLCSCYHKTLHANHIPLGDVSGVQRQDSIQIAARLPPSHYGISGVPIKFAVFVGGSRNRFSYFDISNRILVINLTLDYIE